MASSDPTSTWQAGKTLPECLKYVFDNKTDSDIKFRIGDNETVVEAHSFVLKIRSEVFNQILKNPVPDDFKLADMQQEVFEEFLKYLYTDDVDLTDNNVSDLLNLSRKFIIRTLEKQCVNFMKSSSKDFTEHLENVAASPETSAWQAERKLTQCLKYVFNNKTDNDIEFRIGDNETVVKAHSFILKIRSEVFHQTLEKNVPDDFKLADMKQDDFENFLNYLYTDAVVTTKNNVSCLLHLSRKYVITTLQEQCVQYLKPKFLSCWSQKACFVLEKAHLFYEHNQRRKALLIILDNADEVLKSDDFTDVCHGLFFEKNPEKQTRRVNRRGTLGEVANDDQLRNQKYFIESETQDRLEFVIVKNNMYRHWEMHDQPGPNIGIQASAIIRPIVTINRFNRIIRPFWSCSDKEYEAITFSVNKEAYLRGFRLYGNADEHTYNVSVFVKVTATGIDTILAGSQLKKSCEHVFGEYYVEFNDSLHITEDTQYSLYVTITGGDGGTCYGINGKSEIEVDSFVCRFSESKPSDLSTRKLSTDVTRGQIPALVFSVPETKSCKYCMFLSSLK